MHTKFYMPVLKSKLGEFNGLSRLNSGIKNSIVPLFEITPREWDHSTKEKPRTMEKHLDNFCQKIEKNWSSNECFIDTHLISSDTAEDVTCMEYVFKKLCKDGFCPTPVMHIKCDEQTLEGAINTIRDFSIEDIGIRITIGDISTPRFEDILAELISDLHFVPANCHLIFDLSASNFENYGDFVDGIMQVLEDFPNFGDWKSFTICGSSFPSTNLLKVGVNKIPRNEWKFYLELVKKINATRFKRSLNFGDYSMVASGYFEYDPLKMSRSANIRYTHNDFWYVVKGKQLKKSEDYKQYVAQAMDIINSGYYLGEAFSEGDAHIRKCSLGETKPGSPTVWSWVANNHHFTKVVLDLFSNSPAA